MATVASYSSIGNEGKPNGMGASMQERFGAIARGAGNVARGAGNVALGATNAMSSMVTAPMPTVTLATQPLNPAASLTLRERIQLVAQSCRDWRSFVDIRAFNLPPAAEVKLRYAHNLESYFYNYLVLTLVYLIISGVLNPLCGLQVLSLVGLSVLFYVTFPGPIPVPLGRDRSFPLGDAAKHAILICLFALALYFGSLFMFLVHVLIFGFAVVAIHGFIREHRESVEVDSV